MRLSLESILGTATVRAALQRAWQDSEPGVTGGHEEGGFIVQDDANNLTVLRWPKGLQSSILLPPHHGCRIGKLRIVASFHTHPNTSAEFLQEPSETDKRAVRDDPDLKDAAYIGELVISQAVTYLVTPAGQVREVGDTEAILAG